MSARERKDASYHEREALEIGLREHERALDQALAERDRLAEVAGDLAKALDRIKDELGAPPFKGWDDYYAWVQSVAETALTRYESLRGGAGDG